ncbi:recombination mediator RecR [Campylobacter cuniculorum]|uniref:Recombination protein RecR n=2 Tax=Campylobacter cuniculorum TaxID=374106 RepID=A0A1W6BX70_9BACT|nr:recombination mediator RecR [Campylobacter cuniculorum]ARJ56703.1 recombination protein [Campylobacter cuniculorum DSM 23162 = LMG 24588]QOR04174.1 recombination protein RecR [Campylobacter cuniculorum]
MKLKGLEKFNSLVESFANLPTIGKKTALRLAFHLCMNEPLEGMKLAHNIENALRFIRPCEQCGALSENELCEICTDLERQRSLLCITQSPKDVLVIEESQSYNGLYFILNELDENTIQRLRKMIQNMGVKELIFALTHSLNSDAMIFFIEEKLKDLNLKLSKIAQGIPNGVNLENVDFISLRQALIFRTHID